MTPFGLLSFYPQRSRPLVTQYRGRDSRVELSVITVGNALAKAAGLLRDGLGLQPGAVVSIDLALHWQVPIWTLAGLAVGAQVGADLPGEVDVRLIGPGGRDWGDRTIGAGGRAGADGFGADQVGADGFGTDQVGADGFGADQFGADQFGADQFLVSSCDDFGLPVRGGVPAGMIDVGIEARGYPDVFSEETSVARMGAIYREGHPVALADLDPGLPPAARVWIDADPGGPIPGGPVPGGPVPGRPTGSGLQSPPGSARSGRDLPWACLRPILVGGSMVLADDVDPEQRDHLMAAENAFAEPWS